MKKNLTVEERVEILTGLMGACFSFIGGSLLFTLSVVFSSVLFLILSFVFGGTGIGILLYFSRKVKNIKSRPEPKEKPVQEKPRETEPGEKSKEDKKLEEKEEELEKELEE